MSKTPINDGGPAFPMSSSTPDIDFDRGMTLRDYFAAKAMLGLIEGYDHEARMKSDPQSRTGFDDMPYDDSDSTYASRLAGEAYIIADAMLIARREPSVIAMRAAEGMGDA